jgi:hypothetical protein
MAAVRLCSWFGTELAEARLLPPPIRACGEQEYFVKANSTMALAGIRFVLAAALTSTAVATYAQEPTVSQKEAEADANVIVAEIRQAIAANYVLEDKIPAVDAALSRALEEGRYTGLTAGALADRINEDLFQAARDKHLAVQFDPARASTLTGPIGDEITEGPKWERLARSLNHGVMEMRVLEGNVRYVNLQGFVWTGSQTAAAFDNLMRFLAEGDAVIIDLRYNGGGSPRAIQYLISHFVEPDSPLMTFYMGGRAEAERYVASGNQPAGSLRGKPLYVLTSRMSISAAEAFAALVQDYEIGQVVGEQTAGAAYRNSFYPIANQYMLSVSVGRGEVGPSKLDWEGVGIEPSIPAEGGQALDTAHLHALRGLAPRAAPPERRMLEGKAAVLQAHLNPIRPVLPLQAYAGEFHDRTISAEGEVLYSQRRGGPRTKLLAVAENRFIMENDPSTQLEFTAAGERIAAVEVIRADGSRQRQDRTR